LRISRYASRLLLGWRQRGLDIPAEVVSARVNATQEVIEDYYDERTPRERMEQRRPKLEVLD
jgi:hypothetical protein